MKPKKLIRNLITDRLKEGEWEVVEDMVELNQLYALKVNEELEEIKASDHKDIMEFVDLIHVVYAFARVNGYSLETLKAASSIKSKTKGMFHNLALNNLNPENPSNAIYFKSDDYVKDAEK